MHASSRQAQKRLRKAARLGELENEEEGEEEGLRPGDVEPRPKAKGKAKAKTKGKPKSQPKQKAKGKRKSQAPDASDDPITPDKKKARSTGLVPMTPDGNEESEDSCEKEMQQEDISIKEENRSQKARARKGSPKQKKVQRRLDAELEEAAKDCVSTCIKIVSAWGFSCFRGRGCWAQWLDAPAGKAEAAKGSSPDADSGEAKKPASLPRVEAT